MTKTAISLIGRTFAAVGLAVGTLAPLGASAQVSGTNGQVYFLYQDSNKLYDIAAMNPDGSESHIVVQASATDSVRFVAASPNGSKILYTLNNDLMSASADGSNATTLVSGLGNTVADFSSDGATVYYTSANGSNQIINSVPAAGGTSTALVTTTNQIIDMALDSVHNKIYYIENVSSVMTLKSVNTDGTGGATVKAFGADLVTVPDVSPDGNTILLSTKDGNGKYQLTTLDTATATTQANLTSLSDSDYIDNASYSPDGTTIVFGYNTYGAGGAVTYHGGNLVPAAGGTVSVLRADATYPFWTSVALAAAGTYPTALPAGGTTAQAGGGDPTATDTPGLPDTGSPVEKSLPYLLIALGLGTVVGIEITSRVRRGRS